MLPEDSGTAPPRAATRRLPGAVVRLGWISFLLDVASEMVYPLIPLFLSAVLAAPGFALGLIEGAAEGLLAIVTAISGWRSDKLRARVPFLRAGYGIAALSKPFLALVGSWPAMLGLRALDRLGKGIRTAPRDALIADLAGPEQRGRAFGFHRSMDTAGAVVGVLIALGLLALLPGRYRTIFALTAIPGLAAVALVFTVREPAQSASDEAPPALPLHTSARALPAAYWRSAACLWLFALGNSSDTFLLLRARSEGFSDLSVIWAYALYNVVYSAIAFPAGSLSDRIGRKRVIALGWLVYAGVYAGFAACSGPALWGLFLAYGLYMGLTQGVARALVADAVPARMRGTALGVYHLGAGVGLLSSSALAGWLWDHSGHAAPFWVGAAFATAALVALPLAASRRPR